MAEHFLRFQTPPNSCSARNAPLAHKQKEDCLKQYEVVSVKIIVSDTRGWGGINGFEKTGRKYYGKVNNFIVNRESVDNLKYFEKYLIKKKTGKKAISLIGPNIQ